MQLHIESGEPFSRNGFAFKIRAACGKLRRRDLRVSLDRSAGVGGL